MLGSIRDKASGWIAGIIVGALIISFALWGVNSYFGQGGQVNVAMVNDTEIDLQTYQRALVNLRRQMQQIFGEEISLDEEELIRQQTLQRLIDTSLVNQIVAEQRLRISDQQVANTIQSLEIFQDESGFDMMAYELGVANLGLTPKMFELEMRKDLLAEQLQSGIAETVFVTEAELNQILKLDNQTRDITYALLSVSNYIDDIEVSDEQVNSYYETNKNNYKTPEMVKIAYIDLDVNKIAESIKPIEDELRAYYQSNKDTYDVDEQRSVTKLFVKIDEEAGEEQIANAKTVIENALAMANDGIEFEKIIEEFTEEGKGALQFSEHAFVVRGIMGDEIDEFLFSAEENEISGMIESKDTFNIIKVGEIRGGPKNIYEKVAEQVVNDYKLNQAQLKYFELSDQLTTLAYEYPDSLELAAEAIDSPVQESDYFARDNDDEGIIGNDRLIASSCNEELISSGINSDAIELGENHIAVIRVLEHKPSEIKPLEYVKAEVIADIKQQLTADKLESIGKEIISQLKDGVAPEALEIDKEIKWESESAAKRDSVNISRSILRKAFQLTPSNGQVAIDGYRFGSGDYAVVMVTAVEDGNLDNIEEGDSKKVENELKRLKSSAEWREFLTNSKDKAKVMIFEENI